MHYNLEQVCVVVSKWVERQFTEAVLYNVYNTSFKRLPLLIIDKLILLAYSIVISIN